ncbi:Hypothetical protein PEIBARAKI_5706 [Petrimonas sp. IBARAKI]|nr:Hypothetical protein PEIBARAKI_5706 [Petrimonas sp. IBARAKI]
MFCPESRSLQVNPNDFVYFARLIQEKSSDSLLYVFVIIQTIKFEDCLFGFNINKCQILAYTDKIIKFVRT